MTNVVNFENAFQEHLFDGRHSNLKDLPGFGGSAGKAISLCSTVAEIKAACEDSGVYWVLILEGSYDFADADMPIAVTSYTNVIGLGHVQLDMTDASSWQDVIFYNTSAAHVILENLHFIKAGNSYSPCYPDDNWILRDIKADDTGGRIRYDGDDILIDHCDIACIFDPKSSAVLSKDIIVQNSIFRKYTYISGSIEGFTFKNNRIIGAAGYLILVNSTAAGIRDVVIDKNTFEGASAHNILFNVSGTRITEHIRITNNTCNAGNWFIRADDATLTVNDVLIAHNTIRDMSSGIYLSAGTQNRWRFVANIYESITTKYNFLGGTQNNFIYSMDGP